MAPTAQVSAMSQNILDATSSVGRVRVTAGWDAPLEEVFCNVQGLDNTPGISQDDYPECLLQTSFTDAQHIAETLHLADIHLPQQMIDAIQSDCDKQVGNVIRVFNPDGSICR